MVTPIQPHQHQAPASPAATAATAPGTPRIQPHREHHWQTQTQQPPPQQHFPYSREMDLYYRRGQPAAHTQTPPSPSPRFSTFAPPPRPGQYDQSPPPPYPQHPSHQAFHQHQHHQHQHHQQQHAAQPPYQHTQPHQQPYYDAPPPHADHGWYDPEHGPGHWGNPPPPEAASPRRYPAFRVEHQQANTPPHPYLPRNEELKTPVSDNRSHAHTHAHAHHPRDPLFAGHPMNRSSSSDKENSHPHAGGRTPASAGSHFHSPRRYGETSGHPAMLMSPGSAPQQGAADGGRSGEAAGSPSHIGHGADKQQQQQTQKDGEGDPLQVLANVSADINNNTSNSQQARDERDKAVEAGKQSEAFVEASTDRAAGKNEAGETNSEGDKDSADAKVNTSTNANANTSNEGNAAAAAGKGEKHGETRTIEDDITKSPRPPSSSHPIPAPTSPLLVRRTRAQSVDSPRPTVRQMTTPSQDSRRDRVQITPTSSTNTGSTTLHGPSTPHISHPTFSQRQQQQQQQPHPLAANQNANTNPPPSQSHAQSHRRIPSEGLSYWEQQHYLASPRRRHNFYGADGSDGANPASVPVLVGGSFDDSIAGSAVTAGAPESPHGHFGQNVYSPGARPSHPLAHPHFQSPQPAHFDPPRSPGRFGQPPQYPDDGAPHTPHTPHYPPESTPNRQRQWHPPAYAYEHWKAAGPPPQTPSRMPPAAERGWGYGSSPARPPYGYDENFGYDGHSPEGHHPHHHAYGGGGGGYRAPAPHGYPPRNGPQPPLTPTRLPHHPHHHPQHYPMHQGQPGPYPFVQQPSMEEKTILRKKFSWKHYPPLENFLITNRDDYLKHSQMNYTAEQKQYNNWLTEQLIQVAGRHNYEFDPEDFNFVAIRDRIRCYYKSYVQTARKRGLKGFPTKQQKGKA